MARGLPAILRLRCWPRVAAGSYRRPPAAAEGLHAFSWHLATDYERARCRWGRDGDGRRLGSPAPPSATSVRNTSSLVSHRAGELENLRSICPHWNRFDSVWPKNWASYRPSPGRAPGCWRRASASEFPPPSQALRDQRRRPPRPQSATPRFADTVKRTRMWGNWKSSPTCLSSRWVFNQGSRRNRVPRA